MTNFDWITQDVEEPTVWLSGVLDCDFCPAKKRCKKHGYTPNWNDCMKRVREWLKRDEEAEERPTCQESRQDGLECRLLAKEVLERASKDPVDHPNHYKLMDGVEVIDIIDHILSRADLTPPQDFCLGNVIKYIMRADLKNGVEDYKKAAVYLNRLIDSMERGGQKMDANEMNHYEDGYIKALRDFTDLARTDLYAPLTFYDEGVNTGLTKAIDVADYLARKMKSGGVKNDE